MKAVWKGAVIAESDQTVVVEGNHYFPPNALNHALVRSSDYSTMCGWKGRASYGCCLVLPPSEGRSKEH